MEHLQLNWMDYIMLSVMLCGSLFIGIYCGRTKKTQKTINNYFLGGKNMSVFPVSMSLLASSLSALSLLGIPAEVYSYGTQYFMIVISWFISGLVTNYIFLPVFFKLQLTTTYEYFELRFNRVVRKLASGIYLLSMMSTLPLILYGPALAFNQVSGFNVPLTAVIISSICIIYTSLGGLKGVIWADTFQLFCTFGTLGTVLIMGTMSVGGFSNIWNKANLGQRIEFFNMNPDPTDRNSFWAIVFGTVPTWLSVAGIGPSAIQRFLAVRTFKDSKRALFIYVFISTIIKLICCFTGLIVYAKYFDCDPLKTGQIRSADQIVPYYVVDVASELPGLSGVFVSGLVSTALGTLSAFINTLSGIIYQDFVGPLLPETTSEIRARGIMKFIAVVIGVVTIALIFVVERLGTIVQMSVALNGVYCGPLVAMFIIGMLLPIVNIKGILCGTIGSMFIMSIIVIKAQLNIWNGTWKMNQKPQYTFGCNSTKVSDASVVNNSIVEKPFWLFTISIYYYAIMGMIASITIAVIVSFITKKKDDIPVDLKLLSPCIYRFLRRNMPKANGQYQVDKNTAQELSEPFINASS